MTGAERALLFAIRNTVDALLLGSGAPVPPEPCRHEERESAPDSTLGNPRYQCARCHAPVEA